MWLIRKNYIYIAAASDNEISLDLPGTGGLATKAWLECMSGKAVDADGSGGLTVEEIQVCAQEKINEQIKGSKDFLPQHLTVIGNSKMVMTLAGKNPDAPQQPGAQVTNATPITQPVSPPAIQPAHREAGAPATLLDIFNGKDDRRTVEITPVKNSLKIGSDKFSVSLHSSHAGYLYLLMVGSDGKTFDLLFPNKLDGDNYLQAGQTLQFPRTNWEVVAQGPAGKDHILAIVADAPRDLTKLPMTNAGPFSVVPATSGGKRGIQLVTSTPSAAIQSECSDTRKRNLAVQKVCSDAYGTHRAVTRYEQYRNRYRHVLRCDIYRYFPAIDHAILKGDLRRRIGCEPTLALLDRIIDGSNPQEEVNVFFPGDDLFTAHQRRRGLPIGNLTSQLFGNVYLNGLDHYAREVLRAPYLRYVDDFALFHDDPAVLAEWQAKIARYLEGRRLLLHPRKTLIQPTGQDSTFLGYVLCGDAHRRLPEDNLRRFRNRLRGLRDRWRAGTVEAEEIQQRVASWIAHADHADTWRLRHALFRGGWFDPSREPDALPTGRVLRGGSWNNKPQNERAANRNRNEPANRNNNNGFRLASTLSPAGAGLLTGNAGVQGSVHGAS